MILGWIDSLVADKITGRSGDVRDALLGRFF
jgi:hypothetical protein